MYFCNFKFQTKKVIKKMRKIAKIGVLASLSALLMVACGHKSDIEGFDKTKSGLHYQFLSENSKGDKVKPGDVLYCECTLYINEEELGSVVGDPEPLFKAEEQGPFQGCLNEGLLMMHVGDEAIFAVNADSLSQQGVTMPQKYQSGSGQTIRYKIKLHALKSEAQLKKDFEADMESRKNGEKAALEQYIAENGISQAPTAEGLYVIPIKKGNGPRVEDGKTVEVNYTGRFLDGTIFDTSDPNEDPEAHETLKYVVGQQSMIKGWDMAVRNMCQGEKVRIIVPSELGYGAGDGRAIPPYSTLVFDIELLSVK